MLIENWQLDNSHECVAIRLVEHTIQYPCMGLGYFNVRVLAHLLQQSPYHLPDQVLLNLSTMLLLKFWMGKLSWKSL